MNPKPFISIFFVWLLVFLLLISPFVFPLQLRAEEATGVSGVLGRTVPLYELWDDFEDPNWKYDYGRHISSNGFWWGTDGRKGPDRSNRGDPTIVERVLTPKDGKIGSTGALKISTDIPDEDNDPSQEDFYTARFEERLGRKLTRAEEPVFLVYVWLPPFNQWGDYYKFGFRKEFYRENGSAYYASIFFVYDKPNPFFVFRIHPNLELKEWGEVKGIPIRQSGWWTLAIAFDKNGIDYYYAHPGAGIPTEGDKIFDTRRFKTKEDKFNPSMDKVNGTFFSLMYPGGTNSIPAIIIDDYEVWMIENVKKVENK